MKKRKNKGFTLIEMLVVIAIIGILATMITPAITSAIRKAKEAKCLNNLKQFSHLLQMYEVDGGDIGNISTTDWLGDFITKAGLEDDEIDIDLAKCPITEEIYDFNPTSDKLVSHENHSDMEKHKKAYYVKTNFSLGKETQTP